MELPDRWLESLRVGEHAQRSYRVEVGRLGLYLAQRGLTWRDIGRQVIARFRRCVARGDFHSRSPATGSLQQTRRIVSAFLRWGVGHRHFAADVLVELDAWQGSAGEEPRARTSASWHSLPAQTLTKIDTLDGAAAALSFWTGATPAELAALSANALDLTASTLTLMRRGAPHAIHVPSRLSQHLSRLRRPGRYFFGADSSPPTPASVARRISTWLESHREAGPRTSRELRAQFLQRARQAGWSLEEVRAQLRRPHLSGEPVPPPDAAKLLAIERASL